MTFSQFINDYGGFALGGMIVAVWSFIGKHLGWFWGIIKKVFLVEYFADFDTENLLVWELLKNGKKIELGRFDIEKTYIKTPSGLPEPESAHRTVTRIDEKLNTSGLFLYKRFYPVWYTKFTDQNDVLKIAAAPGSFKCFRLLNPIKDLFEYLNDLKNQMACVASFEWKLRPLVTVAAPYEEPIVPYELDEVQNELLEELKLFKQAEGWYKNRGLPYRRGLLLYGKPGCGKTEFPKKVAQLWDREAEEIINFTEASPTDWFEIVRKQMSPTSIFRILVLNDLHCIFDGSRALYDQDGKVTFEQFINGLSRMNNCLFFITTNDVSKIDPALGLPLPNDPSGRTTRPGRMDRAIEFTVPSFDCRYRIAMVIAKNEDRARAYASQSDGWTQAQLVEEVSRAEIDLFYKSIIKDKNSTVLENIEIYGVPPDSPSLSDLKTAYGQLSPEMRDLHKKAMV